MIPSSHVDDLSSPAKRKRTSSPTKVYILIKSPTQLQESGIQEFESVVQITLLNENQNSNVHNDDIALGVVEHCSSYNNSILKVRGENHAILSTTFAYI